MAPWDLHAFLSQGNLRANELKLQSYNPVYEP